MRDNHINIESDSEGNDSSSLRRRMELESHSLPFASEDFESEMISLSENSETEGVSGDFFLERASSSDS